MFKKYSLLLLGLIVLLGFVLRFSLLGQVQKGVTPDEVQQGYSAYSILKTGHDEWGDLLPVFPRSFGDYRPPLYVYLTVPFVAIFGLNIEATRMASAFFGGLTILVIFFLAKELFRDVRVATLAALFLAISTWHIFYSRAAWESNAGVFFLLLGILFFLRGMEKKGLWFSFSAVCFGVSMFSYYSFKLLTPLLVFALLFIYRKQILPNRKKIIPFLVIFIAFFVILVSGDVFFGGARRASDTSIFNSQNLKQLRMIQVKDGMPQPFGRVINNRPVYLLSQFSQNYFGYFSTTFLVSPNRPDSSLYNLPGEWLISLWEFGFLLAALIVLIKRGLNNLTKVILAWLLLTPLPAALTTDYMHTQRVEFLLFLIPILSAFGAVYLFDLIKKINLKIIFGVIFAGVLIYSLFYRVDHYLFHQFNRSLGGVHYGYDQIFEYTEKNKDKFDRIIFTKEHSEPQIFLAFYTKMDPNNFQKYSPGWKWFENEGFKFLDMTNYSLGKYSFQTIEWNRDKLIKNTMIVGSEREIPDGIKPIYQVVDPFGKILFKVVDTNGEI